MALPGHVLTLPRVRCGGQGKYTLLVGRGGPPGSWKQAKSTRRKVDFTWRGEGGPATEMVRRFPAVQIEGWRWSARGSYGRDVRIVLDGARI